MNKVVIVSGGANGLGLELVKVFNKNGYFVCNIDKDEKAVKKTEKQFKENYKAYIGDVSDEKFVIKTFKDIAKLGQIFGIVNNAGAPSFKMPTQYVAKDVDLCFEGLKGMIYLSTQALKIMEGCGGKIINIMSSAALKGNKQEAVYCATKWAERGYTESLKAAYSGTKIHIYGVYPGGINTNFYKNSRDYVSIEKQNTFMPAKDLAEIIYENIFTDKRLVVEDLIINRIK